MGSCIQKNKNLSSISKPDSFQRKFSSIILKSEYESNTGQDIKKSSSIEKPPCPSKPVQGSVLILDQSIILSGLASKCRQQGFEDKRVSINSSAFTLEDLFKIGISVTCKKGLKPESPNQDDYFVLIDKSFILFGVFDGHGLLGHEISNFISSNLPHSLISSPDLLKNPLQALKSSFEDCQHKLVSNTEGLDCSVSGCTATLVLITNGKLFTAHVGDSRAVIAEELEGHLQARNLTRDHKPNLPDEEERIKAAGGEIKQFADDGPYRIFKPGETFPGINMSRAFGDTLSQQFGVIAEPELSECDLKDKDLFLLICSDGIWEFITSQEAAALVHKCEGDSKKASEKLAALAWMRWKKKFDSLVDDMTVIVVHFKNSFIQSKFVMTSPQET